MIVRFSSHSANSVPGPPRDRRHPWPSTVNRCDRSKKIKIKSGKDRRAIPYEPSRCCRNGSACRRPSPKLIGDRDAADDRAGSFWRKPGPSARCSRPVTRARCVCATTTCRAIAKMRRQSSATTTGERDFLAPEVTRGGRPVGRPCPAADRPAGGHPGPRRASGVGDPRGCVSARDVRVVSFQIRQVLQIPRLAPRALAATCRTHPGPLWLANPEILANLANLRPGTRWRVFQSAFGFPCRHDGAIPWRPSRCIREAIVQKDIDRLRV